MNNRLNHNVMDQSIVNERVVAGSLSPGRLGDGISFRVVAVLVSVVVNALGLALRINVTVGAADYNDAVGLVFLINNILQLTLLLAGGAFLGLVTVENT